MRGRLELLGIARSVCHGGVVGHGASLCRKDGDAATLYDPRMRAAADASRHAAARYRRLARRVLRPLRAVEAEAHHLHEVERKGEVPETPLLAMLGLVLFLFPILFAMLGLAALAVYLFD
jgi:hypothetical protein